MQISCVINFLLTNHIDRPYENSNTSPDGSKNISNDCTTKLEGGVPKLDSVQNQNSDGCQNGNNKEDKKVHFNKFATVQMME